MHKDNGWNLLYTRKNYPGKWSFWSQEYEQQPSQFYSEDTDILRHAKRVAATNSLCVIPFVLFLLMLINQFRHHMEHGIRSGDTVFYIILAIGLIEFGLFIALTISYYLRVRRTIARS